MGRCSRRRRGITLQILIYLVNGTLWLAAFWAIGFGLTAGFGSNTISLIDFNYLDFAITTPATIFIFYGVALLITTTAGCYAAVSSRIWIIMLYCLLIIAFIGFDVVIGIHYASEFNSYEAFLRDLKRSQKSYSTPGEFIKFGEFGIVPIHPKILWDHFQTRGQCCGLLSYEEWNDSSIASEELQFSIPDSCCNVDYEYPKCGVLFWRHPDHGTHTKDKLINNKGCLYIFPDILQFEENKIIELAGKLCILLLVICFILAFILLCLVCCKKFKPDEGLANPDALDQPRRLCLSERTRVYPYGCGNQKVCFDLGPHYIPNDPDVSD